MGVDIQITLLCRLCYQLNIQVIAKTGEMGHGAAVTSLDLAPWSKVRARASAPDVAKELVEGNGH